MEYVVIVKCNNDDFYYAYITETLQDAFDIFVSLNGIEKLQKKNKNLKEYWNIVDSKSVDCFRINDWNIFNDFEYTILNKKQDAPKIWF